MTTTATLSPGPLAFADLLAGGWKTLAFGPFRPGLTIHRLYQVEDGPGAAVLHYEPGAAAPPHEHLGYEHIFVLEGSQEDEHGHYPTGSVVINPPGSRHSVTSAQGCVVLIVWEKPIRIL